MRCKACDRMIHKPMLVTDLHTETKYEEWICSKCNRLSFANHDENDSEEDYLMLQLELEGYIKQEDT